MAYYTFFKSLKSNSYVNHFKASKRLTDKQMKRIQFQRIF